jgi:kynurenine formamidase
VQKINMLAGLGTHMDAPAHCISGGRTIENFTLEELISPCVVIDVSIRAHELYSVTKSDIVLFEHTYGKINAGTFVFIRTGWDKFWNSPVKSFFCCKFPYIQSTESVC